MNRKDEQGEEDDAEGVADHGIHDAQVRNCVRHGDAHGLVEEAVEQEGGHADGQGGGIEGEALVDLGGVVETGGHEVSHQDAQDQRQCHAGGMDAYNLGLGIAHHQLGHEGRQTGGEEHGVGTGTQLLTLDDTVDGHTDDGGPDVQNVDAPGAEAHGQQGHQGGGVVGLTAGDAVQGGADQTHQTHVQEGGGITADVKEIGGGFGGTVQDLPQTVQHAAAIRHKESGHQKAQAEAGEEDL